MNLRFILLKGILAMLFVATAISCEKDQREETKENIPLTSEVVRAKEFVEARMADGFSLKSAGGEQSSMKIRARWEKAKVRSNNHFVVVEADLEAMGQFGFMSSETYQKFQESGNPLYKYSLSRMVVLENKRTGKMYSFIMSIAGDREYLERKRFTISGNGYLDKEQDFSGFVLFHELTGEFTNGWVYCDGKITNTIVEADKLGVDLELKQATIHYYYVWVETCTDYIYINTVNGEILSIGYNGTKCTQQEVYGGSYTIGSEMPTSGGGGEYGPAVIEAGEACGCTICPVCGGCMVDDALKVAQLPGDDTPPPTSFDCEVCSCVPTVNSSALEANPKANCIYEKLISGEILQDFISRFFGPTEPNHSFLGELNLTWKLGITTETLPIGVPNNNVGYSVEIRLNETAINSGSVTNVALSMLHEALHAKLIAEVYDEVHSTDFWTLYRFYGGWGLNGLDAQQELEMLQFYSERMAQALQKIDLSLGITHSLDFYKDGIKFDLTYQLNSDGHLIDLYEEGRAEYEAIFESTKICEP